MYFHTLRSHGGDGGPTENPFLDPYNANSGFDYSKLASWKSDLQKLDAAGVILWINLFDDSAYPYGCEFNSDYLKYATGMVNYFKDLKNVVWITQEEYNFAECQLNQDQDGRQRGLAKAIRAADPIHPIATHHKNSYAMAFPDDGNIRVFGQQSHVNSVADMHAVSGFQGWGNWVYVMVEAHPWHKDLMAAGDRTTLRKSNWATAMAGGYVMMYDSFEFTDPTDDMLNDLRRLSNFMETTLFNRMVPVFGNELINTKLDFTEYILANKPAGLYILYGSAIGATQSLGVRGAPAGSYEATWYDPVIGAAYKVNGGIKVNSTGEVRLSKPGRFSGTEAALYLRRTGP